MLNGRLQSLLREGEALRRQGRLADAFSRYERACAIAPDDFQTWHHGGMVALLAGNIEDAVRLLARALKLKPSSHQTAFGLAVGHIALGKSAAAEAILRRIVAAVPAHAEAWHHLALVLKTSGRLAEAMEAQRRAVTLKPDFAQGWQALGATLALTGKPTEALACFDRALKLESGHLRAQIGRAMTLYKCHRVAEAEAEFAAVLARDSRQFEARSYRLMTLNCLGECSREEMFAEHAAFGRTLPLPPPRRVMDDPERRLRVAFLSPDLREHSVSYFLEPLLRHLDADAFEIVLYHDHPIVDAVSAMLRIHAALWRNFAGQADEVVEKTIRADAPDILVDLAGHTGLNRLPLLARRLAPVQITYLGYPNTTGLPAIDYRFVDALTDPAPDADAFHTEKLVRFSEVGWSYLPPADAPEPAPPPCLERGGITFGSFNNFAKATDKMLRLWSRVLDRAPGSRLLLKAGGLAEPAVREPLLRRLEAAGLGGDRVELLAHTPDTASHLALYRRVDVALDPFPYHGTTTTCEALWMGVPVVSLLGDRHASRVGFSLLTAVGCAEWVARTPEEYLQIAAGLASDPAGLAALRTGLRGRVSASLLCDHAGQAARFGAAVRDCWRRTVQPASAGVFQADSLIPL
jgi:predicted O-linked N-acetylglucosamine transferase (SPINDLY family)